MKLGNAGKYLRVDERRENILATSTLNNKY